MKKHFNYLIAVCCFLSMAQAQAAGVFPASADMAGYNPGAFNTTEMQNMNNYQIDKGYVQSIDDVTKYMMLQLRKIKPEKV